MRIAFLGDIALLGKYDLDKNKAARTRLTKLSAKLAEFDYVVGNLESPLTNRTRTFICKSMHLKSPTINVDLLKYLNINAVSLANNHLYDFGTAGLADTIETLNKNNIEWFGANSKALIKEINGERISLSGFCCYSTNGCGYLEDNRKYGINTLTHTNITKQLEFDKKNHAFSITSLHWGDEHTNFPKYEHVYLANKLAQHNKVIIFGHHPHVIQGIQSSQHSLVAYSLGNCLFDDCRSITGSFVLKQNQNNKKSFILDVNIENAAIASYRTHGFKDEESGLEFFAIEDEINEISQFLNKIDDQSIYENMRQSQIRNEIATKFGKRNFKWFLSRLNYYSIGAFISARIRKKKYLNDLETLLGGK